MRQSSPTWLARCAYDRLHLIAKWITPRVHGAVVGALWNRWCTWRCFQLRGRCRLCQADDTDDSIEHFSACKTPREFGSRRLRLHPTAHISLFSFMCTNPVINTQELLVRVALLIYATYSALNYQRHAVEPLRGTELYHGLCHRVSEGVRNNNHQSGILGRVWTDIPQPP